MVCGTRFSYIGDDPLTRTLNRPQDVDRMALWSGPSR
jgi:hypothetical protein